MNTQRRVTAGIVVVLASGLILLLIYSAVSWNRLGGGFKTDRRDGETGRVDAKGAQRSGVRKRLEEEANRKREIMIEMMEELGREDSGIDLNDPDSIRRWSRPLLEMEMPVMEPFLQVIAPFEGQMIMLPAIVIGALEWDQAVEELFLLVDSRDERIRLVAEMLITSIYAGWWLEDTRKGYGALDLANLLEKQYREHGPLSSSILSALGAIWEGDEPPIDFDLFESHSIPERFRDLEKPAILAAAMESELWNVRDAAAYEAINQDNLVLVIAGLKGADDRVSLIALQNLMSNQAADVVSLLSSHAEYPALLRLLHGRTDPRVRAYATLLYGRLVSENPELGDELLIESLSESAPSVQHWALEALRDAGRVPPSEEDRIFGMVSTSPDLGVRCSAARFIRKHGSAESKEMLNAWLAREEIMSSYVRGVLEQIFEP